MGIKSSYRHTLLSKNRYFLILILYWKLESFRIRFMVFIIVNNICHSFVLIFILVTCLKLLIGSLFILISSFCNIMGFSLYVIGLVQLLSSAENVSFTEPTSTPRKILTFLTIFLNFFLIRI